MLKQRHYLLLFFIANMSIAFGIICFLMVMVYGLFFSDRSTIWEIIGRVLLIGIIAIFFVYLGLLLHYLRRIAREMDRVNQLIGQNIPASMIKSIRPISLLLNSIILTFFGGGFFILSTMTIILYATTPHPEQFMTCYNSLEERCYYFTPIPADMVRWQLIDSTTIILGISLFELSIGLGLWTVYRLKHKAPIAGHIYDAYPTIEPPVLIKDGKFVFFQFLSFLLKGLGGAILGLSGCGIIMMVVQNQFQWGNGWSYLSSISIFILFGLGIMGMAQIFYQVGEIRLWIRAKRDMITP